MLYVFPIGTRAAATRPYQRPYDDPIAVAAGTEVWPDLERTATTDILGWTWCRASDGREGWVPEAWLERRGKHVRLRRAFSALELTLAPGEKVDLLFSESGFVFCRKADGAAGWVPDGALTLLASDEGR